MVYNGMKVRILGSGGGEGFPASFCTCEHCEMARKVGGKSLRTLSQTIFNDDLLVDFPSDTNAHCLAYGINLGNVQHILITHAHSDHYFPLLFSNRGGYAAHNMKYEKVYIYGSENLEKIFEDITSVYGISREIRENIEFVKLQDGQKVKVGKYNVTALSALHAPQLSCLNYIIEENGKSVLYLLDSGYPTEERLQFFEENKMTFDAIIMDGTMGEAEPRSYIYHMCFEENKALKEELLRRKIATEKTRFIVTHITHNQAQTHDKIEGIFAESNMEVAYDGYEFEV